MSVSVNIRQWVKHGRTKHHFGGVIGLLAPSKSRKHNHDSP